MALNQKRETETRQDKTFYAEGGERSDRCPTSGTILRHVVWSSEQPALIEDAPGTGGRLD